MSIEQQEVQSVRTKLGSFENGGPMPRLDAKAKASGAITYAGDVMLPRMAHVAVARSTMPHALITAIDTAAAKQSPGVIGVFTAEDVNSKLYGRAAKDMPVLARGKVRFVGERVAAVVAEPRQQAEVGASPIEITSNHSG